MLHVVGTPAVRNPDGSITPPGNDVRLAEAGDGVNIVDMIMSAGHKEGEAAERIYDKWLAGVNDNGTIRIESVGTISEGRFTIDGALRSALNPGGPARAAVKRNKTNLAMTIVLAAIAGVAISLGVITYFDRNDDRDKTEAVARAGEAASAEAPGETAAAVETPTTAGAPVAGPQAQTPAQTAAAAASPGYYVIIGYYSTDANAERFIAECKQTDNTLQYGKLPLRNGKIMVYTSKWSTEEEARAHRRLTHFPEAWVYKYGG